MDNLSPASLIQFACFMLFWAMNIWLIWMGINSIRILEHLAAPFLLICGFALLALQLDLAPVEVRRRNLIPPFREPHRTATGALYDSGDYEGTLCMCPVCYGIDLLERAGDLAAENPAPRVEVRDQGVDGQLLIADVDIDQPQLPRPQLG